MKNFNSLVIAASAAAIAVGTPGCSATGARPIPVAANDNHAPEPPRSPTTMTAANDNHPLSQEVIARNLKCVGNYKPGADPRLFDVIDAAAGEFPGYRVETFSGFRSGDPRFHGKRAAIDIRLIDERSGTAIPNYQDEASFRIYERFAQKVREKQLLLHPEINLRWGGYFSGKRGVYGAMDLMHFDIGSVPMGGGSWEHGLTETQKVLWPGAESVGMIE
jgi:hypothetical protein